MPGRGGDGCDVRALDGRSLFAYITVALVDMADGIYELLLRGQGALRAQDPGDGMSGESLPREA